MREIWNQTHLIIKKYFSIYETGLNQQNRYRMQPKDHIFLMLVFFLGEKKKHLIDISIEDIEFYPLLIITSSQLSRSFKKLQWLLLISFQ